MKRHILAAVACVSGCGWWMPSMAQAQPVQEASIGNRESLAWWYLEVDRAWTQARASKDAAGVREAHSEFDLATLSFFKLDAGGAVTQLSRLRSKLDGHAAERLVDAIALAVEPRVWIPGTPPPSVRLRNVDAGRSAGSAVLKVTVRLSTGVSLLERELTLSLESLGAGVEVTGIDWEQVRAAANEAGENQLARAPMILTFTVQCEGAAIGADRLIVSPWSLKAKAGEIDASLTAEQRSKCDAADVQMFESRLKLLTDSPSRNKSSEFLADYSTLPRSLELEAEQLRAGRSPYPLEGAWWSTVRAGKTSIPVWFSAPSPAARVKDMPLVIVFHGAGGDENMFISGYGQGQLVRDAVARGMVVASPGTGATMGSRKALIAIVEQARRMYGVDPMRISVVGHSMGGGAASSFAQKFPTQLAAAVCFAGGSFDPRQPSCPALVLGGELDPIIPGKRLESNVGAAAGLPLTFRMCPGNGHTLIVGDHVKEALDFLEGRKSQVAFDVGSDVP